MTTSFQAALCSEFPNDNPELSRGARWVCPSPVGPARALLRQAPGPVTRVDAAEAAQHAAEQLSARAEREALARAEREAPVEAEPVAAAPVEASRVVPAPVERRYEGPLELDLSRIVLAHRVENIPPPPDFIFRPFVSSRLRAAAPTPVAIEPRPCRVVDEHEAGQRVERGLRVDVAPCLSIGDVVAAGTEALRRQPRRRGPVRAVLHPAVPDASPPAPPLELEAQSA